MTRQPGSSRATPPPVRVILLAGAVCTALAGCQSGTPAAGSRSTLYATVDELSRDSTAIVGGTVTGQTTDGDAAVSEVSVESTPRNPNLGSNAPATDPVQVGDVVRVRQDAPSRPLLEVGRRYVRWLTPTMLDDAPEQFFITGSNAGMFVVDGDAARRVATDTGDTLPDTIEIGR